MISRGLRGLVFCSFRGTFVYSQLRRAKNRAPASRVARALSRSVLAVLSLYLYTSGGSAFWCFVVGSSNLYALVCLVNCRAVSPDESLVGSGLPL